MVFKGVEMVMLKRMGRRMLLEAKFTLIEGNSTLLGGEGNGFVHRSVEHLIWRDGRFLGNRKGCFNERSDRNIDGTNEDGEKKVAGTLPGICFARDEEKLGCCGGIVFFKENRFVHGGCTVLGIGKSGLKKDQRQIEGLATEVRAREMFQALEGSASLAENANYIQNIQQNIGDFREGNF